VMQVELARDVVLHVRPPLDLAAQRQQLLFQSLVDGPNMEFRVAQETNQQFHRAVPGPPAHAVDGAVHAVGAEDDGLDGVGVGQLLVVVGMEPQFLIRGVFFVKLQIAGYLF